MSPQIAVEALVPRPQRGRVYTSARHVRLSDMDARGRLRLDAVARYLQDVAIDDVDETGWGAPQHLWFVRRYRVDVVSPFLRDRAVELATWCSGTAPLAAGRRTSVVGDRGGRIEVDSVWIHLGPDGKPARLEEFGVYRAAAGDRRVSTKLHLPDPPPGAAGTAWLPRATDIDLHGHLNNAAYWGAIEERLAVGGPDPTVPLRAVLEYRAPIDLGDEVELVEFSEGGSWAVAFCLPDGVKAVARLEQPAAGSGSRPEP